jgi:hypothetical protein
MGNLKRMAFTTSKAIHNIISIAAAGLMLGAIAYADDPTPMAPPIQMSAPQTTGANSAFNWREVPANQQVPVRRAAFDQGGYQIYDTVGETIVVPFTNQNLYVMKFAVSHNGTMYFVNSGSYPVLYVPKSGYLDNATVAGARWYPFGGNFQPAQPVYLGIAPSWSVFIGMGWYPNMFCYGGYWSHRPFIAGSIFVASAGLFFEIGGRPYFGWNGYHRYFRAHPAPYHIAYFRRDYYRYTNIPHTAQHRFVGAGRASIAHRTFTNGHSGGGRVFRGASGARLGSRVPVEQRGFNGARGAGGVHEFNGGARGAGRPHGFTGGSRAVGGQHTFNGGVHAAAGDRRFSGGAHANGGGSDHARQ